MRRLTLLGVFVFGINAPALAQQEPKVGVTMGYPASIGILWHASDRFAVRPDFNVSQSSSTSEASTVTGDSWAYGLGLSGLIYVSREDKLRTYVSPRFVYSRSANTTSVSTLASSIGKTEANGYQVAGSFGAQYGAHRRFGIFGEFGVGYAWTDSTFTSTPPIPSVSSSGKTTAHSWGTRTAVGVVLYFD